MNSSKERGSSGWGLWGCPTAEKQQLQAVTPSLTLEVPVLYSSPARELRTWKPVENLIATAEGRSRSLELVLQELSGQCLVVSVLPAAPGPGCVLVGAGTRHVGVLCHQPDPLFKVVAEKLICVCAAVSCPLGAAKQAAQPWPRLWRL